MFEKSSAEGVVLEHSREVLETLLQDCATSDYYARMRQLVEYGQRARTDPLVRDAITSLHEGSLYERLLGLQTCYGSLDAKQPVKALTSPSAHLRRKANHLAAVVGTDTDLALALLTMHHPYRLVLVKALKRQRRSSVIDTVIGKLQDKHSQSQRRQVCSMLPFASVETVEQVLATSNQLADELQATEWVTLAKRFTQQMMEPFYASKVRLCPPEHKNPTLWIGEIDSMVPHLPAFSTTEHAALDLVKLALDREQFATLEKCASLAKTHPMEISELLLGSADAWPVLFGRLSRRLATEHLIGFAKRSLRAKASTKMILESRFMRETWRYLSDEQRISLFDAAADAGGTKISISMMKDLPRRMQIQEVYRRRNKEGEIPAPWMRFLPWDEAFELQKPSFRAKDKTNRAIALKLQIEVAAEGRGDELIFQKVLDLMHEKRNDQDDVRCSMLSALNSLETSTWSESHLPALTKIIRDGCDAKDLSHKSAYELAVLAGNLLDRHPAWSWEQMMLVYRERSQRISSFLPSSASLRNGVMDKIAAVVQPTLREWRTNDRKDEIVWLAVTVFPEHPQSCTELQEALLQLYQDTKDTQYLRYVRNLGAAPVLRDALERHLIHDDHDHTIASVNMAFLMQECPNWASQHISRLIAEDRTWIRIGSVQQYLRERRQDLLTPFLTPTAWSGRFNQSGDVLKLDMAKDMFKLTSHQQELCAYTLRGNLRNELHDTYRHKADLNRLSYLHFVDPVYLISYVHDERTVIQDLAMVNLNHLDGADGYEKLTECLEDDRARTAIYAIRPILRRLDPSETLALLRRTSLKKVAVAKEVIRLVADLENDDAFNYLLELECKDLHIDARTALLKKLNELYTERQVTWSIFQKVARGKRGLASEVAEMFNGPQVPQALIGEVFKLAEILITHPSPKVRISLLQAWGGDRLKDPQNLLLPRVQKCLESRDVSEHMQAYAIIFTHYHTRVDIVRNLFESLILDRMDFRLLDRVLTCFSNAAFQHSDDLLPATRAVLDVLKTDRLSLTRRVRLIFRGLPWEEMVRETLQIGPLLHADALVIAEEMLVRRVTYGRSETDDLERQLGDSTNPNLRRLGLVVLKSVTVDWMQHSPPEMASEVWTKARQQRLEYYKEDSSALVAEAASTMYPPDESSLRS